MKLPHASAVERLATTSRCLGAVFTTFTFDPAFFEEELLAAVLHLGSDPLEQPARYHDEARRALQEVPVACIVDAGMRQPGHRLPYDLLEVHGRTFHPKVSLLLYEEFARLQVGSGNLTRGGYGGNTELFFNRDLRYDDGADTAALREVDQFLRALTGLVRHPGTQLTLVREELARRLRAAGAPESAEPSFRFLHSEAGGLLEQLLALLPAKAVPERVGILAPFLEQDDGHAGDGDVSSVLLRLAQLGGSAPAFDLGVLWEDPPVHPDASRRVALEEGLGRLWALKSDSPPSLTYLSPTELTANRLRYLDASGAPRQMARADAERSLEEGRLWATPPPRAFAPPQLVEQVRARSADFQLWLHPARRVEEDRPVTRPLHAKLFLITVKRGSHRQTFVLLGSPNASRRALLQGPEQGGNVEAAVAFVLEGAVSLAELVPGLVACAPEQVSLAERDFPAAPPNLALLVQSAVHDAVERTLCVTWAQGRSAPEAGWTLLYKDRPLVSGGALPSSPSLFTDFTLSPASCELVLRSADMDFTIPITVLDLAALPTDAALSELSLTELLALLGRRIGRERLAVVRTQRGVEGTSEVLAALFGDGFGPVDVFRAWWGLEHDLADSHLSVAAFRARLEGTLGARAVWSALLKSAGDTLAREEAWFYGAELARTLRGIDLGPTRDGAEKQQLLGQFLRTLATQLEPLAPAPQAAPWLGRIVRFYGGGR
jgi:hypothetical protein